jgi:hypothetical protein
MRAALQVPHDVLGPPRRCCSAAWRGLISRSLYQRQPISTQPCHSAHSICDNLQLAAFNRVRVPAGGGAVMARHTAAGMILALSVAVACCGAAVTHAADMGGVDLAAGRCQACNGKHGM